MGIPNRIFSSQLSFTFPIKLENSDYVKKF
jgi:hypothetical protein